MKIVGCMNFKLNIPKDVYDKVMYFVHKADFEVSGFGKIVYDEQTREFTVKSVHLLEQEGTATTTDIDPISLMKLQKELANEEGELRWWWHSHVNMNVFWSGTDTATIKDIGRHGWLVATVFNKKEEMRTAVCYRSENNLFGHNVTLVDEVETILTNYYPDGLIEQWDQEFDANVKRANSFNHTMGFNTPSMLNTGMYSYNSMYSVNDSYGLLNYSVKEEAAALKMTPRQYVKILNEGTYADLEDLEMKLISLEAAGHFDKLKKGRQ